MVHNGANIRWEGFLRDGDSEESSGGNSKLDLRAKELSPNGEGLRSRWVKVCLAIALVYAIAFPLVTAPALVAVLQASDREFGEAIVRGVLFPFGDVAIYAQGITQAFVGYLTDPAGSMIVSGLPIALLALIVALLHLGVVGLIVVAVGAVTGSSRRFREAQNRDR